MQFFYLFAEVAHQVKYEMEKKGQKEPESQRDLPDDDAAFGKFEGSWFASLLRSAFGYGNSKFVDADESD